MGGKYRGDPLFTRKQEGRMTCPFKNEVVTKIQMALGDITPKNVEQLKTINSVVFPVRYSDKFYEDAVAAADSGLVKLAYHNDVMVGGICSRLEKEGGVDKVYIMTLGVLAPYQG